MRNIIVFFAKEHLLGNLITIFILSLGAYGFIKVKREIWPDVSFDVTSVTAFLGGASPEQVEKLLINPIENSIKEVDGLKSVFATATESQAVIILQIDPDARDSEKTNRDIQTAVDGVTDIPSEVERPLVRELESADSPIIEITVGGEADKLEIREAAKRLADELSLIPEVSKVIKRGYEKLEYKIIASPQKLAARQVSLSDLINSLSARNVSIPGGSTDIANGKEMLVRTEAQFTSLEDILNHQIVANAAGFGTKIKDVASVTLSTAKPAITYRANGKSSINLVVTKKKNADALNLVEEVKTKALKIKESLPQNIEVGFSNDFSIYLENRLSSLGSNLFLGLILVILVLILFLPKQVTLVVAAGIPIALLATVGTAYLIGVSLNVISLIGLIIVLGMLVDDAIVVSENVWRHVEMKKGLVEAVADGAREVFGPVLASVLTTISAFAPMMFMTGIMGSFIFEIPVMVILALLFSLFEVFIIMPSHFTSWVGTLIGSQLIRQQTNEKKPHWFDKYIEYYKNFIKWSLTKRYYMLGGILGLLIFTIILTTSAVKFSLFPGDGIELFFISVETPTGTSLEKTESLVKPIEKQILRLPKTELKDLATSIGIIQQEPNDPQTRRGSNFAHIRISLTPQKDRNRAAHEIVEDLRKKIIVPEGVTKVSFEFARQGPPQGQPIAFSVLGEDFLVLKKITDEIKAEMSKLAGIRDIRDSFLPGKTEWQVVPISSATAEVGLTAAEIAQSVRASFEGIVPTSIRSLDEEIDVRVKLEQTPQKALNQLKKIQVGNRQGQLISLPEIAEFQEKTTLSAILHLDFKRTINIGAEVDENTTTAMEATAKIRPIVSMILKKYPGYDISWGGEDKDTQESMISLGVAFLFAAFFIFCLLVIVFRNLLQPILILTSIPLGFMGVVYAMLLHNRPLSFMAMLGMIALAGVIVNNSIVLIDFVNKGIAMGQSMAEAIIDAAGIRLRPIVLTTVTTVSGLLPTAYGEQLQRFIGIGGEDAFIVPIALALAWGLAIGTVLVTIFFPSLICILDDLERLGTRILSKRPQAKEE